MSHEEGVVPRHAGAAGVQGLPGRAGAPRQPPVRGPARRRAARARKGRRPPPLRPPGAPAPPAPPPAAPPATAVEADLPPPAQETRGDAGDGRAAHGPDAGRREDGGRVRPVHGVGPDDHSSAAARP